MMLPLALLTVLVCYVIGSFPTAYIVGRINHINIFEVGSGNMGANNVSRALGFKWGALVWAIDSGKGILAVTVARMIGDPIPSSIIGAISVVIGHNWSVLATLITGKLRGGKGVSTAFGTWLMLAPYWQLFVIAISTWGAVVLLTRYVSLGALVAVGITAIWMFVLIARENISGSYSFYVVFLTSMIYIRHWKNIRSLLAGQERRLGEHV